MTKLTPSNTNGATTNGSILKRVSDAAFGDVTQADIVALGFTPGSGGDIGQIQAGNTYTAFSSPSGEPAISGIMKEFIINKSGTIRVSFTVSVNSGGSGSGIPTIQLYNNGTAIPGTGGTYGSLGTFNQSYDITITSGNVITLQSNNSWSTVVISNFLTKFDVINWSGVATVINP